jgi:hypothetical protein
MKRSDFIASKMHASALKSRQRCGKEKKEKKEERVGSQKVRQ